MVINLIIAAILGALRVVGHKEIAFQAIAHLFVGFLVGGWVVDRKKIDWLGIAIGLSVIELLCFFFGGSH